MLPTKVTSPCVKQSGKEENMKIRELEKMTNQELVEIQNKSIVVLEHFNYDIDSDANIQKLGEAVDSCLLYTSPSPRD